MKTNMEMYHTVQNVNCVNTMFIYYNYASNKSWMIVMYMNKPNAWRRILINIHELGVLAWSR